MGMSNSYFQFKQFRIEQERCAMKVTTDACIQGAWTPVYRRVRRVLDIGAGTGLLSLMLAQKAPDIIIDGIELDAEAALQARANFNASAWNERLRLLEGDVCSHPFASKYGLIISNPPFFSNSLLSHKEQKNMARHTASLTYQSLFKSISDHLAEQGYAAILLPYPEYRQWNELLLQNGWAEFNRLFIRHTLQSETKRVISLFSKCEMSPVKEDILTIKEEAGTYTREFRELLAPYYLDL
jgi:tRNA1Val (adenine37-N6)-methyltransferase